jgi:hypothetical protein
MLSQAIKSNELKFKVFRHGNVEKLVDQVEEWMNKGSWNILDIAFIVAEEQGWIYAIVTYT